MKVMIEVLDKSWKTITLPYNATNGDVIKALFPYITAEKTSTKYFGINFDDESRVGILQDWWNAPYTYKKEQKQKEKTSNKQYVSSDCGQCIYADGYNGWDDHYCKKHKTWLRANMLNCEYYKEQNNDT